MIGRGNIDGRGACTARRGDAVTRNPQGGDGRTATAQARGGSTAVRKGKIAGGDPRGVSQSDKDRLKWRYIAAQKKR